LIGTHQSRTGVSWIRESWFAESLAWVMFIGMSGDQDLQKLRWTIRRLIELVDQGIDSAGEQLSKGEPYRAWRAPVGTLPRDDPDPEPDRALNP
jgi:hypothetical protein